MLNIVSEAVPQHLTADLPQAAHAKLPEPELGLQPKVRKFRHGTTQAIKGSRRAQRLYQQLDVLHALRREARKEQIQECRKHAAPRLLCSIPFLGPIRAGLLIGRVQTPHRFRSKRQFWAYCGLALETRSSADYRFVNGQLERTGEPVWIRGLNLNHIHDLKNLFKSATAAASARPGPFGTFYQGLLAKGMLPAMARLTLARKIAAITLSVWKKGDQRSTPLCGKADVFSLDIPFYRTRDKGGGQPKLWFPRPRASGPMIFRNCR